MGLLWPYSNCLCLSFFWLHLLAHFHCFANAPAQGTHISDKWRCCKFLPKFQISGSQSCAGSAEADRMDCSVSLLPSLPLSSKKLSLCLVGLTKSFYFLWGTSWPFTDSVVCRLFLQGEWKPVHGRWHRNPATFFPSFLPLAPHQVKHVFPPPPPPREWRKAGVPAHVYVCMGVIIWPAQIFLLNLSIICTWLTSIRGVYSLSAYFGNRHYSGLSSVPQTAMSTF